ncbi:RNA recognition domain containing protein [Perkinsela sp. CCAP 1560/4]|nr:RNA recognition domain containing protein [Perkinsela sp. CCAP 1560/4]|eukprot:KNH06192.1 RNA recognition domain containing protein [Perkinsela sp. CCAP 1560/4]
MLESSTLQETQPRDSTRIRVTSLPKFVTKEKLRSAFCKYGEITDLVILKNAIGHPRMAFIGYRQPIEAKQILKENSGMYLDSHKVHVDLAHPVVHGTKSPNTSAEEHSLSTEENHSKSNVGTRTKRETGTTARRKRASPEEVTDQQFLKRIQKVATQINGGEATNEGETIVTAATPTDRIILKNLAFCTTKEAIRNLCEDEVGGVESVHIPMSLDKKRSRGIAFVRFRDPENAAAAVKVLQNFTLEGRLLVVEPASPDPYAMGHKSGTAKPEKNLKCLKNDGHSALFLDSNTISKATSKELGIAKESLLDPSNEGVATRTAISEAVLTSELEDALRTEGINARALENGTSCTKSSKVILVKNIQEVTTEVLSAVKSLFQKYGVIERVSAPKLYGIVVVAFQHDCDALKAFRRLAFCTALGFPLLLEWAPSNIFSTSTTDSQIKQDKSGDIQNDQSDSFSTIFVKNLPRGCSAAKLRHHVLIHTNDELKDSHIRNIRVVPNKGYAFIEFYAADKSTFCINMLNNKLDMDGRVLSFEEVKEGTTKPESSTDISVPQGCDSTKITIKNVPFEATVREIRSLFSAFSDIRSVRLPKKLHQYQSSNKNNHRGFAFVEFSSSEGAAEAMKMLKNIHLYGRRLCLEYASVSS